MSGPIPPAEPPARPEGVTAGPFYTTGAVTLWHGDALDVLRSLPDGSVDAVITDPPYSSGGLYRTDRAGMSTTEKYTDAKRGHYLPDFGGDNRDQRGYGYWCTLWLTQCLRVTKPGGILTVATDWRQLPTVTDVVQAGGWTWRGILAWAKPDARPQFGRYRNACEFIVWATNGHRPIRGQCLPGWWLVSTPRQRNHQTEKWPLSAWEPVIYHGGRPADPSTGPAQRVDSLVHGVSAMTTLPGRVIGAKPPAFSRWIFQLLGAQPGDTLDDHYPGSGAVTRAWAAFTGHADPSPVATRDASHPARANTSLQAPHDASHPTSQATDPYTEASHPPANTTAQHPRTPRQERRAARRPAS